MKKYLSLLLIALMMITVLFISISCSQEEPAEEEPSTYTVTFDTQGGSTIAPVSVYPGYKVKKPATDPTRSGYVFKGWYKDAACKTEYKFSAAVNGNITIYAKWIAESDLGKVTLKFNYDKADEIIWTELNKTVTIPTPTRKGFVFLGWYEDPEFDEAKKFNANAAITKNVDLYAKWISQTDYEHSDPILPTGTGQTIPTNWSDNPKGMDDLPAIIYNFSGERTDVTNVTDELKAGIATAMATPGYFDEYPTKILFVFSDGWGVSSVDMSREYKGELILDSLPYYTQSRTDAYEKFSLSGSNDNYSIVRTSATDSCAGGTQVLCGYKTRYGYIAVDVDANPVTNLSEAAKAKGWYVACVTNDNIADATPADAIVHETNRYHDDVIYFRELMANDWDLLMGWDWGMDSYFTSGTWADRLEEAAKEGIKQANKRESTGTIGSGQTAIQFFKGLSTTKDKAKVAPFLIYYHLWERQDASRLNSWQRWVKTGGETELNAFLAWLDANDGLKAAIADLDANYGNPSDHVNRFLNFKALLSNTDTTYEKPVLGSWKTDGADYDSAYPNRGYLLRDDIGESYPSWPEMVAYTIYQMDKEAGVDGGFFVMIENTCTDGWGHSTNSAIKVQGQMNEVQCFDEGVAIAVKYVLEHPDTLLVVSADHETGGFEFQTPKNGTGEEWKDDFTMIKSTTTGHSTQVVPLYAFGAGAEWFSKEKIQERYGAVANAHVEENGFVHEGWITGALMGWLMSGKTADFGMPSNYKGE